MQSALRVVLGLRLWPDDGEASARAGRPTRIGPVPRSRRRVFRSPPSGRAPARFELQSWRDDPEIAELVAKMSQRRFRSPTSRRRSRTSRRRPEPTQKRSFCARSPRLSRICREQRSRILAGLDRFGRKQRAMADRIRTEADAVQKSRRPDPDRAGVDGRQAPGTTAMGSSRSRRSAEDGRICLRDANV